MMVDPDLTRTPDPTPFPDQRRTPEQISLHYHLIEAAHVSRRVLAAQARLIRENIELHVNMICRVNALEKGEMPASSG